MRTLLAGVLTILLAGPSWAAITCTGQSFPFNVPTDPQAQDYTVPSVSNGITFVHAAIRSSTRTVNAATIGGNAMTQVATKQSSTNTASELFYRLNVTSGVNAISVDWDNAPLSLVLTAVTCEGVNQSAPIPISNTATGSGNPITVDCAGTTSGQLVLDFVSVSNSGAGFTAGANQTGIDQDVSDALLSAGASSEPGGGTITMSETIVSGDWTTICAVLAEASSSRNRGGNGLYP